MSFIIDPRLQWLDKISMAHTTISEGEEISSSGLINDSRNMSPSTPSTTSMISTSFSTPEPSFNSPSKSSFSRSKMEHQYQSFDRSVNITPEAARLYSRNAFDDDNAWDQHNHQKIQQPHFSPDQFMGKDVPVQQSVKHTKRQRDSSQQTTHDLNHSNSYDVIQPPMQSSFVHHQRTSTLPFSGTLSNSASLSNNAMPPPTVPRSRMISHLHGPRNFSSSSSNSSEQVLPSLVFQDTEKQLIPYDSNKLPPQFRSLYNASTVNVMPNSSSMQYMTPPLQPVEVSQSIIDRFLTTKSLTRKIASELSQRDAYALAMSSTIAYRHLDCAWWHETFPEKPEQSNKLTSWTYIWPQNTGSCQLCYRLQRIVLQEPSKARLCHDCMQLSSFRMVKFAVAKVLFNIDNDTALELLKALPFVHDNEFIYFWINHLEWVEAQCKFQAKPITSLSKKAITPKKRTLLITHKGPNKSIKKAKVIPDFYPLEKEISKTSSSSCNADENQANMTTGYDGTLISQSHSQVQDDVDAEGEIDPEFVGQEKPLNSDMQGNRRNGSVKDVQNIGQTSPIQGGSAPFPSGYLEDQLSLNEIKRRVRQEYIVKELDAKNATLKHGFTIPDVFLEGNWMELHGIGVGCNDYKGMANWMYMQGMLTSKDGMVSGGVQTNHHLAGNIVDDVHHHLVQLRSHIMPVDDSGFGGVGNASSNKIDSINDHSRTRQNTTD